MKQIYPVGLTEPINQMRAAALVSRKGATEEIKAKKITREKKDSNGLRKILQWNWFQFLLWGVILRVKSHRTVD